MGIKLRSPPESVVGATSTRLREGFLQHLGIKFGAPSDTNSIGAFELPLHPDALAISNTAWKVPAVTAAAMMARKADLVAVGGFDEGYFYSYEDVDLCLKLRTITGKQIICANEITAFHHRGATRTDEDSHTRDLYTKNQQHMRARFGAYLRSTMRAEAFEAERFTRLDPLRVAFLVSTTKFGAPEADFFTAYELGEALGTENRWSVSYLPPDCWYDLADYDVAIAMRQDWDPRKIKRSNLNLTKVAWVRNWFDVWQKVPWLETFDNIWVASNRAAEAFRRITTVPVETIRIATNAERFIEATARSELQSDYCFTGSFFKAPREIMSYLDPESLPYTFKLFGHNWNEVSKLRPYWHGAIDYIDMPAVYHSTSVVIDDCNHTVKHWGSVNSRVFDALASGALVITNGRIGSDEVFDSELPVYESRDELNRLLNDYLSNPDSRRSLVARLRQRVLSEHTYTNRAKEVAACLSQLFKRPRIGIRLEAEPPSPSTSQLVDLVRNELRHAGAWVRDPRAAPIHTLEKLGDDVALHLTTRAGTVKSLEPDQVNVRVHLGHAATMEASEASNFDVLALREVENAPQLETELVSIFETAAESNLALEADSDGGLRIADGRTSLQSVRRFADRLVNDVLRRHIALSTTCPEPAPLTAEPISSDAETAAPATVNLVVYPDYRATNPYQDLLYQDLGENFKVVAGDIQAAISLQKAPERAGTVVFHIHWTSPIIGLEPSPLIAARKTDAFINKLEKFRRGGGQVVWTIHNIVPHELPHPELEFRLCRAIASAAHTIHVHSAAVPMLAAPFYKLPPEKIAVGAHGNYIGQYADEIDRSTARLNLGLEEDATVFLFLGQIRGYKGVEQLIEAFRSIEERDRPIRLLVVGNPVNMENTDISTLAAGDARIFFVLKRIPDEEIQFYARAADFVVLPYQKVLTSGSVFLALSFGLPVIAPASGLIPDTIDDGVEGFVYSPENSGGLREALERASDCTRAVLGELSGNALRRAEMCDWQAARGVLSRRMIAGRFGKPVLVSTESGDHSVLVWEPPVAQKSRVAAVILHYESLSDTLRCARSLLAQDRVVPAVFIVSNSLDGQDFHILKETLPDCTIVQSADNIGYAGGNNLALAMIAGREFDFVWIVNPDTEAPKDFLQQMLSMADINEDVAIFGPRIMFGDRPDVTWFAGGEVDWRDGLETRHIDIGKRASVLRSGPVDCDYITGASLFFRTSVSESVGFLPERYFLYFEETHWCLDAAEKGLRICVFPQVSLLHYKRSEQGGAPTSTFLYYYCRNALLMCQEFKPGAVEATERRLRRTLDTWVARVAESRPQDTELARFAGETGFMHGNAGRSGRFDIEAEFELSQAGKRLEDKGKV